jgi:hypothetical protein
VLIPAVGLHPDGGIPWKIICIWLVANPHFLPTCSGKEFQGKHGKNNDDNTEQDIGQDFHASEEVDDAVPDKLQEARFRDVCLRDKGYRADNVGANFHHIFTDLLIFLDGSNDIRRYNCLVLQLIFCLGGYHNHALFARHDVEVVTLPLPDRQFVQYLPFGEQGYNGKFAIPIILHLEGFFGPYRPILGAHHDGNQTPLIAFGSGQKMITRFSDEACL